LPGGVGLFTTTLLVQVPDTPPLVAVTVADFVPAVEYVFVAVTPDPERLSVPDHEYVYAPVPAPPLAEAVHVTD